jgi:predicted RecB family nuclease
VAADKVITLDVLRGYLNCHYLAHLLLAGQTGVISDYEAVLAESRQAVRLTVLERLRSREGSESVLTGAALDSATLGNGTAFLIDAEFDSEGVSVRFEGLKRVNGQSQLSDFHYVPVLFCGAAHVHKPQRLLLEVLGVLLTGIQGVAPSFGVIYHGAQGTATTVRFTNGLRAATALLAEVNRMRSAEESPKLLLNPHCPACQFRRQCHEEAVKQDSISLLRGVREKELKRYSRKGLFTLTQLAHTFRPRRKGRRSNKRSNRRHHALHALAIRDKRIYVLGLPEVPNDPVRIYLDIESNPEEGFVYLIGMIVCDGSGETRYSFWADSKAQECEIFDQLVSVVTRYESPAVFCYGGYERAYIQRMRQQAARKRPVEKVLAALVNTLSIVYSHFYFPTYSNGLKDIAAWLAFKWTDPDASGLQSIAWRIRWERTGDDIWKMKIIEYNLEDCGALRAVTEFIRGACGSTATLSDPSREYSRVPPVMRVQELDKLADTRTWGKVAFVHDDFEFVNNCAYFDYQRQRVFLRSGGRRRRRSPRPGVHLNRRIRPARCVEIRSSKCPQCGCKKLVTIPKGQRVEGVNVKVKRALDLVVTPGGIKRRVMECRAAVYRCSQCGHCFASERYHRFAKHFHGLMSWAMYGHVAHQLSAGSLEQMLYDFFGLSVSNVEILTFKSLLARFYRPAYNALLTKIVNGAVLHVDETYVTLRTGKGFVWVLGSPDEVVYMYRATREAQFLQEMLRDFHGVLISDFYAGYDSIRCPQQKCLIHLIRDMNQELLNNPFDEELQSITKPFGSLLRSIVTTIDEHGLKRRHLARHSGEVEMLFQMLSNQAPRSESARALRERLLKWRDKLFTFIQYDSVPWNNNNAENAIKQFAFYRENSAGTMKEPGLNDYLVLLSIYQTCRYRGISFLRFLLSRSRSIDEFCAPRQYRRRGRRIEVYPRGYAPYLSRLRGKKRNPGTEGGN